ncbi:MAG: hypothetical protein MUO64_03675 [Anaerolineales bacterium]|nr:hypothetical protein [Anaerolineales bacterium]
MMSLEVGLGIVVLGIIIGVLLGKPKVGLAIALLGGLIAVVVFLSIYHLIPAL